MTQDIFSELDSVGLNLHAVFEVDCLPADIRSPLQQSVKGNKEFRQLILIGNGGPLLWSAVKAAATSSPDPIDDFSVKTVSAWLGRHFGDCDHQFIYPGNTAVGLQRLGGLAGWHNASPFKVGINQDWGTWFAYRVALLANTSLPTTKALKAPSPCDQCSEKPCVTACPAQAMAGGEFDLARCIDYRMLPDSHCSTSCVSRLSCPVGSRHRYDPEQIAHGYSNSLQMIRLYREKHGSA